MEKMVFATSTQRGQMRPNHSSHLLPFVVGLLVVIAILAFNYWSVTTANRELSEQVSRWGAWCRQNHEAMRKRSASINENLQLVINERDIIKQDYAKLEAEMRSSEAKHLKLRSECKSNKGDIENLKNQMTQINKERDETSVKGREADEKLNTCNEEMNTIKKNLVKKDNIIKLSEERLRVLQSELEKKPEQTESMCDEREVREMRIGLLTKLQTLGGSPVIELLTKAGVDTSGVILTQPQPPQVAPDQRDVKQDDASQEDRAEQGENQVNAVAPSIPFVDTRNEPHMQPSWNQGTPLERSEWKSSDVYNQSISNNGSLQTSNVTTEGNQTKDAQSQSNKALEDYSDEPNTMPQLKLDKGRKNDTSMEKPVQQHVDSNINESASQQNFENVPGGFSQDQKNNSQAKSVGSPSKFPSQILKSASNNYNPFVNNPKDYEMDWIELPKDHKMNRIKVPTDREMHRIKTPTDEEKNWNAVPLGEGYDLMMGMGYEPDRNGVLKLVGQGSAAGDGLEPSASRKKDYTEDKDDTPNDAQVEPADKEMEQDETLKYPVSSTGLKNIKFDTEVSSNKNIILM